MILGSLALFSLPAHAASDSSRYLVKSNKSFWKNALGVRYETADGFTTDLSDIQLHLVKLFGVNIEPVKVLQILPSAEATIKQDEIKTKSTKIGKHSRLAPSDQTPWGVETIYGSANIASTSGGANAIVAVLDTGVNINHPDLTTRISECKDFTGDIATIDDKCSDKNGHGTHVAGIILADAGSDSKGIYGVAPEAKLFAFKACADDGSCYADDIANAIETATDDGANVINMSFGSDGNSGLIRNAVQYAASKGVLMVAAAGNDGPFADSIDYPAAYPEVIAVGAIDKTLNVTKWSSRGINTTTQAGVIDERDIEFVAPGENIESTSKDGGYVSLSGTSMASPFIAGLAAKLWQANAENPAQSTRDLLHQNALDILPVGEDNTSGFGLPQLSH